MKRTGKVVTVLLMALATAVSIHAGGSGGDNPWPTVSRHFTLNNFPSNIADAAIAPSYYDDGTTRHAVWPSWDGSHFQLVYSVRVDGTWSSATNITGTATTDSLSPALALVDGSPIALYTFGSSVRSAVKGTSWATYNVTSSTAESLAVHQESGHAWWTWRDGNTAKWIERTGSGWSTVGTLTISTTYADAVSAIRNTVLGL